MTTSTGTIKRKMETSTATSITIVRSIAGTKMEIRKGTNHKAKIGSEKLQTNTDNDVAKTAIIIEVRKCLSTQVFRLVISNSII